MRIFSFVLVLLTFFVVSSAEARSNSNYTLYSYGGSVGSNYGNNSIGSSSSRYRMYSYGNGSSSSYSHRGSSFRRGYSSSYGGTQHYKDPTGKRIVYIDATHNLALPSGNYGRATNRVRPSY